MFGCLSVCLSVCLCLFTCFTSETSELILMKTGIMDSSKTFKAFLFWFITVQQNFYLHEAHVKHYQIS